MRFIVFVYGGMVGYRSQQGWLGRPKYTEISWVSCTLIVWWEWWWMYNAMSHEPSNPQLPIPLTHLHIALRPDPSPKLNSRFCFESLCDPGSKNRHLSRVQDRIEEGWDVHLPTASQVHGFNTGWQPAGFLTGEAIMLWTIWNDREGSESGMLVESGRTLRKTQNILTSTIDTTLLAVGLDLCHLCTVRHQVFVHVYYSSHSYFCHKTGLEKCSIRNTISKIKHVSNKTKLYCHKNK